MTTPTEEHCKITRSQDHGFQRGGASVQSAAAKRNMRIRNPNGPNSGLVITPRRNGGVTITQGPAYVLIGPGELAPVMDAIRQLT